MNTHTDNKKIDEDINKLNMNRYSIFYIYIYIYTHNSQRSIMTITSMELSDNLEITKCSQ